MKVCGYNQYNQLGEESTEKNACGSSSISCLIDSHLDIASFLSISIYGNHTVYINKDNRAFGLGDNNGYRIINSLPPNILTNPQEIIIPDQKGNPCNFISAVCGGYYTLYLVSCGTKNNQLVYVNSKHNDGYPLFLNINGHNPIKLFGGAKTSAAVDETGGIIIITLEKIKDLETSLDSAYLPDGEKVTSVACCDDYIIATSLNGKTFVCSTRGEPNFNQILELNDKKIVYVSGTFKHCFAIDEDGLVFGLGSNDHGQLGIGKNKTIVSKFTEILAIKNHKIVLASAGYFHSVFLSSSGEIYSCGTNQNYELLFMSQTINIQFVPQFAKIIEDASFCIAGYSSTVIFCGSEPPNMPNGRIQQYEEEKSSKKEIKAKKKICRPKTIPVYYDDKDKKVDGKDIVGDGKDKKDVKINDGIDIVGDGKDVVDDEIKRLKNENKELKDQIKNLQDRITEIEIEKDEEIDNQSKKIKKLQEKNKKSVKKIEKLEDENNELKEEIKFLRKLKGKEKNEDEIHLNFIDSDMIDGMKEIRKIGTGATSTVFEVEKNDHFAHKVLHQQFCYKSKDNEEEEDDDDEEYSFDFNKIKRFFSEYEILCRLNHPNIIKVFGFFIGDSKHSPSILLEFCPTNLKQCMKSLKNNERIQIIIEICLAMSFVHSFNIIHRDLKPENILLDSNNHVKLCDFGLCKLLSPDELTDTFTHIEGTPIYMAPELFEKNQKYNEKVDVFAFGVVLYQILMKGKKPDISIADVIKGKIVPIPSNISKFSGKLIKDCLSFDPSSRPSFKTIHEMLVENQNKIIK